MSLAIVNLQPCFFDALAHLQAACFPTVAATEYYYADAVVAGQLYDSTLTFQLNNGFVYYGLIENYVPNDADNMATLIAWHNPAYGVPLESVL